MTKILYLHAGAELYGADIILKTLVSLLDKEKYTPYVILPSEGPLVHQIRQNGIFVEVIPYPILRRKYFNFKGIISYIRDYIKYTKILADRAREMQIDIVHVNTTAVLEGIGISRRLSIPIVWHIHEIIVKPLFISKFLSFVISKYAKETVVVSEAVKKHLKSNGNFKGKIKVIYNGVDSDKFHPDSNNDRLHEELNIPLESKVVGMIGRVNSWKGQRDFVEAMNVVLQIDKQAFAVLAGDAFEGEEWRITELKEYINLSPYKDRFRCLGFRTDSQDLYQIFDVFVLPSTNPDPLPTVVLEAMASGCPIVAYRHGGVCEMVKDGENGLLADVTDVSQLADKIIFLLENTKIRLRMRESSRKRQCTCFSLTSFGDNFMKLYSSVR